MLVKAMSVATWMLYDPAPAAAFQVKVGVAGTLSAPLAGVSSVGAAGAAATTSSATVLLCTRLGVITLVP